MRKSTTRTAARSGSRWRANSSNSGGQSTQAFPHQCPAPGCSWYVKSGWNSPNCFRIVRAWETGTLSSASPCRMYTPVWARFRTSASVSLGAAARSSSSRSGGGAASRRSPA